jgi:hypothetical protein
LSNIGSFLALGNGPGRFVASLQHRPRVLAVRSCSNDVAPVEEFDFDFAEMAFV